MFEQLSGLKINFHKSELFCFGDAKDVEEEYRLLFGCDVGSLPFKYLGIPIHFEKLRNGEWKPIEDRCERKLSCWIGKLLSYGDRLILINSVLTSLPMFMLSFLEIPIGVRKRLDYYRSRFFWQSDGHKRKYRLTKWNIICRPKDQGGLGIEVLEVKNKCLLSKWLFKLLNEEGVWQELLRNKYLQSKSLSQVTVKPLDSPFWKGLMKVKEEFFKRGTFKVGDGTSIRFWEDVWLGDTPLSQQYESLYNIVNGKQVAVADVLGANSLNISFRRTLTPNKWVQWLELVERLMNIQLSNEKDTFVWRLTTSGGFTVKSMYLDLLDDQTKYLRKYIWKIKVPLKIKIFMWFLHHKVILTKDNLAKRNWEGSKTCVFCDKDESIQHLFFECPLAKTVWRIIFLAFSISPPSNITNLFGNWLSGIAKKDLIQIRVGVCAIVWAIWNVRNDFIFNKQKPHSFLQVIPLAIHWIRTWSYIQAEEQRAAMESGCNRLETVARDFYSRFGWRLDHRITI
jgi:hypothetical protein